MKSVVRRALRVFARWRGNRPAAERPAATQAERPGAGASMPDSAPGAAAVVTDEQAGDSFLGYVE